MRKCRVAVVLPLVIGLLLAFTGSVAAQSYPTKPIHIIVPFAPGGTNDILARLFGPKLTEIWGQPVIVDNRPGANGTIGAEALTKSASDGYTMMMHSNTHTMTALLYPVPYDTIKDFAPVAEVARTNHVLVLNPSVSANTLQEFIALAKSKPGQINFGSPGIGNGLHLIAEMFCARAGVKMQHIPYKGASQVVTDLMGGQIQMAFIPPIVVLPQIKAGRVKAIAYTGETRLSELAQVPTFAESGMPAFDTSSWQGFFVPSRTPKNIVDKLSAEIIKIVAMPDIKEGLARQGMEPFAAPPDKFAAVIKADIAKWESIIKSANIKVER